MPCPPAQTALAPLYMAQLCATLALPPLGICSAAGLGAAMAAVSLSTPSKAPHIRLGML
jgi:hypothetical protein